MAAQSVAEVEAAFDDEGVQEQTEFRPLGKLIYRVLREKKFPKKAEPRSKFLAESLAGRELVSARSSRDICERERTTERNAHHVVRYSFHIECSCGYRGKSKNLACAKCGAEIPLERDLGLLLPL